LRKPIGQSLGLSVWAGWCLPELVAALVAAFLSKVATVRPHARPYIAARPYGIGKRDVLQSVTSCCAQSLCAARFAFHPSSPRALRHHIALRLFSVAMLFVAMRSAGAGVMQPCAQ